MERDGPPDEVFARTELILDELRRSLAFQMQAKETTDARSSRLLQLGVVTIGGGVAIVAFALDGIQRGFLSTDQRSIVVGVLASAVLTNLAAVVLFLDAYVGLRTSAELVPGVNETWLAEMLSRVDWTVSHLRHALARSLARFVEHNRHEFARVMAIRRRGLRTLLVAVGLYALAMVIYVGGRVWT